MDEHDPVGTSIKDAIEHTDEVLRLLDLAQDHSDDEQLRKMIQDAIFDGNKLYATIEEIQSSSRSETK